MSTFTPIAISIMPPHSSARKRPAKALPNLTPRKRPNAVIAEDTIPMATRGYISDGSELYPMHEKDIPTARASILVATAKVRITLKRRGLNFLSSSSLNESTIIRTPRKPRIANAIQWSTLSINSRKSSAPSQPKSGLRAWNRPKSSTIAVICLGTTLLKIIPLAIDTAKQSIASAIATSHISMWVIYIRECFCKGNLFPPKVNNVTENKQTAESGKR